MSDQTTPMAGAYLANGTIGNVGTPGAPIVHFSLVVVPSQHTVNGSVTITQATVNGNYLGNVEGRIYKTGLGKITQVVGISGLIHEDNMSIAEIDFEAHMSIDNAWHGVGGFSYGNVHVEDVPVTPA